MGRQKGTVLPAHLIDGVKAVAARRRLPDQTLVRSWIAERLAAQRATKSPAGDR